MIRVLVLAPGTEYGTPNESWQHGAFVSSSELGSVVGLSGRRLRRLESRLAAEGSVTVRASGAVVRLIAARVRGA